MRQLCLFGSLKSAAFGTFQFWKCVCVRGVRVPLKLRLRGENIERKLKRLQDKRI